ncbi:MAG: FAD-dependent oxidoreductase, partial [Thermoproteota archaeon]|nr:FAD-dependent oxidoreductase [Thermoproteota archaeon]
MKLLAAQPLPIKEFWTEHRIKRQRWEGIACQTGFIATLHTIVVAVDADDPKTRSVLETRIDEFGLLDKTIIQDTPHKGKHAIFKIPIDVNKNLNEQIEFWGRRSLRPSMCKEDCVMEIKMRTMQITLDPTKHRVERQLTYTRTSRVITIAELPMLYDLLISDLKNYDCLEYTPDEYNEKREKDAQNDIIKSFDVNAERYNLAEPEILAGINIILGLDEENLKKNSPFKSIYVLHHRHDTVIALGGYLFWNYITLDSTKLFIERLSKAANDSSEDTRKSVKKVEDTYRRGFSGQPVIGKRGLSDAFTKFHKEKNKIFGEQRLSKLTEVLKLHRNKPKTKNVARDGIGRVNEADILVNIAEKEIPFFFVNHLNQPCAVVKVRNHYEIMEMNDDSTFLGLLRQMWRDNNIANNKTMKITISEDMLKRARAALVGAVNQLECPRIKTHLRVAWKEKNKILRYDLTNQFWQQIEISATVVRVIDSRTVLDEIKEYQDSGFSKHKVPIFFQRYSNTQEQVLPTENFRSNILDYYFEDLTNVTDKRATTFAKRYTDHWQTEGSIDNRSKILVAKVLLLSKFIADIPHFLVNVIGSPGAMKTHYLKFDKRLIDPGSTEVHSPPITTKDIHQKFSHNYYIILDNIGFIEKWLSDLICSVITGSGFECRALWTNQGIVNMILKSCVAVGSVNRVFTAPDALTRLVVQEFLEVDSRIDDETNKSNYLPEDVIEAKFEEIRAELLSCIFSILSKAIEFKQKITGKYALGRMADVLEWGEAISQAMGYEEREFQRAYESLTLIQQRHAAKSDPLIVRREHTLKYDYLVIALGSENNFFGLSEIEENAFTMKNIDDAIILRNHMINILEQANLEQDNHDLRKSLLTFVVVGGGFSGVETVGAVNDFVRESIKQYYPNIY